MAEMNRDELDRVLDAALAKYAAAQPRQGLEERVLANLRVERARAPYRAWWHWSVMAALTAAVIVALAIGWKSDEWSHPRMANHPSATTPAPKEASRIVTNGGGTAHRLRPQNGGAIRRRVVHRSQIEAVIAANPSSPKLDAFPSPQPLSEQEKILADYVAQYPEHAALIAQARTKALRQDRIDEMRDAAAGNEQNSQHQDSQYEDR
jgi:hypothetical protein